MSAVTPPPDPSGLPSSRGPVEEKVPVPLREGRAHEFRDREAQRRTLRREQVAQILVVVVLVAGIYAILSARPYSPVSNNGFPTPGPPISVHLGAPSVNATPCAAGGSAFAERFTWANSTRPVTTGDINLHLYEIWDGDYLGDPAATAVATPTSVCGGAPPSALSGWYVVLAAANGTNLLTYTESNGWTSVTHGAWNLWIPNGTVLILVTGQSIASTGRGFAVVGFEDGSTVLGSLPL
jgi:hypothetical protein